MGNSDTVRASSDAYLSQDLATADSLVAVESQVFFGGRVH